MEGWREKERAEEDNDVSCYCSNGLVICRVFFGEPLNVEGEMTTYLTFFFFFFIGKE